MLTAQANLTTRFFLLLMLTAALLAGACSKKAGLKSPELPAKHWLEEAPGVPVENKSKLESAVPNLYDPKKVFSFEDCVFLTIQQSPALVNSAVDIEIKRLAQTDAVWKYLPEPHMQFTVSNNLTRYNMFYNKINVIFLKQYGGNADVGGYGVAWETVEGLSVLVSSALLGKVIFPLLAKLWQQDKGAFRQLAGQTARSLWAASLPIIFLICVESDRFLPLVYGPNYQSAVTAQRLLTPCLATAFLHNLAAYAMIGMRRHKLLLGFYLTGLVCNLICCFTLIPAMPLEGAALSLTITKVWVALLTVGYFQWAARPMNFGQWGLMLATCAVSVGLWWGIGHGAEFAFAQFVLEPGFQLGKRQVEEIGHMCCRVG